MAQQIYDDEILGKAFDADLTRKALVFIRPYKRQLLVALLAMLATTGTALMVPKLVEIAIDQGIRKADARVLTSMAAAYVGIYVIYGIFQYWQGISLSSLGQHVIYNIRRRLFSHLQELSLDFFDKREAGRIISRMISDVDSLNLLLTSGGLSLITDLIKVIAVVVILAMMNLDLTLLLFPLIPLLILITSRLSILYRIAYRDMRRKVATVTARIAENVSGVKVVKSFSREGENLQRFKKVNLENRDAVMRTVTINSAYSVLVEFLFAVGMCIVFWYGGKQVITGTLTIGTLTAFYIYLDMFFLPVRNMAVFYYTMQNAMAGAERIFEILDTEPTIRDGDGAVEMPPIRGDVAFQNVHFSYGETPVLTDVSFTVRAGETVALVGPTGAGKTTIVNLVCRQYDIRSGGILIDGLDIRDVTLKSLRRQVGVVLQDSFLFPGSVKENIRFGRLDATDQEVEAAAMAVNAHEFIARMPKGYDTEVQEGASNLSAGQKQLLSFARALLADPRILILDEATSSIDTYTELLIQEALRKLLKGRTSFVIAHRLSTIVEADRILVISGGRIVESGRHEELLGNGGLYRHLYEMQFRYDLEPGEVASEA